MRFFESNTARRQGEPLPDERLRVALALILGATVFGSLWAMADEGPKWAAVAVTIGLAKQFEQASVGIAKVDVLSKHFDESRSS